MAGRGNHRPMRSGAVAILAATAAIAAPPAGAATLPVPTITAGTSLVPSKYDPAVLDYSVTCPADRVTVQFRAPSGVSVGIAGATPRTGVGSRAVTVTPGRRFAFVVQNRQGGRLVRNLTHWIRCRPADVPVPTVSVVGKSQLELLVAVPRPTPVAGGTGNNYMVIYDRRGTPLWWHLTESGIVNGEILDWNTIINFQSLQPAPFIGTNYGRWVFRALDGHIKAAIQPPGGFVDHHDIVRTPSGTWLTITYERRDGVDLSSAGGPHSATVYDGVIREITNSSRVLWTWSTADHTTPGITGAIERPVSLLDGSGTGYDLVHTNSLQDDGDGVIVSLRAYDTVIRFSKATGQIDWKLGGRTSPQSLRIIGDPVGSRSLVGQHDAKLMPDGTLSIFDNGSTKDGFVRAPRVARFRIDRVARTATFLDQITDPLVKSSICCGSRRILAGGNSLIAWGGTTRVTETDPAGKVVLSFAFPARIAKYTYRALPATSVALPRDRIQEAMDRNPTAQ